MLGTRGAEMDQLKPLLEQRQTGVTAASSKQTMPAQQFPTRQRSMEGGPRGEPRSTAGGNRMSRRNPRSRGSDPDRPAVWGHQDQGD